MSPRQTVTRTLPGLVVLALAAGAALHSPAPAAPAHAAADPSHRGSSSYDDLPATSVVADGFVDQVATLGDRVYVRGSFSKIGTYTGAGRVVETGTGADLPAPTLPNGQVSAVVSDGAGGWYVGGDFGIVYPENGGLMHVLADGTVDPDFTVGVNNLVTSLALHGDTLYVGGAFQQIGGTARNYLAAVSATDGSVLDFTADQSTYVTELVAGPDALYVGSDHVEAVDLATGDAVPGFTPTADGHWVRALEVGDGHLYVGTDELTILDATTGAEVEGPTTSVVGPVGTNVSMILYAGPHQLYVGSNADTIGGRPGRLVVLDPATGVVDPTFDPQVSGGRETYATRGGVFDLALDGDDLWVGGAFTRAGGQKVGNLAVLDAATGQAREIDVPSVTNQVNAVEISGDAAYLGGHFFLADDVRTKSLAALDATTLQPVPGFRSTHWDRSGGDLVVSSRAIYQAPTHFYGYYPDRDKPPFYPQTDDTVWAYDPDTGGVVEDRTHEVRNLTGVTTVGNRLVVAQRLGQSSRFPANRITVYAPNGTKQTSYRLPVRGYIAHLTTVDGDLLAVGSFKGIPTAYGPLSGAIVRFDLLTGRLAPGFNAWLDGPVYHASVRGSSIYVNGLFSDFYPEITKMSADSRWRDEFAPKPFDANGVLLRTTALGDKVWVGGPVNRFLDATTGAVVADPTGDRLAISSVTTVGGALVYGAKTYDINMAGSSANQLGYVARVAD